jgi:hypothetical protein
VIARGHGGAVELQLRVGTHQSDPRGCDR